MILSGNTLYGTAIAGGVSGYGTVFAVNTDGTGFTNLHSFTGGTNDGVYPNGGLILSGNTLYGTANQGGTGNNGTIFGVNTDGTGYATLHYFAGDSQGAQPTCALLLSGDTLYGTTDYGGSANDGTVFGVNTDDTGFAILYSFTGGSDGAHPFRACAKTNSEKSLEGGCSSTRAGKGGGAGRVPAFAGWRLGGWLGNAWGLRCS